MENWKRNVALFLSGQTVSLFGSMTVQYAVMWHITFETKSGLAVALYVIAAFAVALVVPSGRAAMAASRQAGEAAALPRLDAQTAAEPT